MTLFMGNRRMPRHKVSREQGLRDASRAATHSQWLLFSLSQEIRAHKKEKLYTNCIIDNILNKQD